MKVLFLFAPAFHGWAKEILKEMKRDDPSLEIIGIATSTEIYDDLKRSDIRFEALYDLSTHEQEWVETYQSIDDIKDIEGQIGAHNMIKTIVADKVLGKGWITGAKHFETPLSAVTDNEDLLKCYVTGMYKFYLKIFDQYSPDLTFLYAIAGGATFALATTAQQKGNSFYRFQHSRLDDYFIIDTSKEGLLNRVRDLIDDKKATLKFHDEAVQWLADYRANKKQPGFFLSNANARIQNEKWIVILRHTIAIIYRLFGRVFSPEIRNIRSKSEMMHFNNKVFVPIKKKLRLDKRFFTPAKSVIDKDYLYFPLHVEPEAATLVTAPYHTNQLSVIEALSKSTPLSMSVIVKEHPTMLGKRPKSFYKTIQKMPNVTLIDQEISNFELIDRAKMVATISGTTGWECILAGKSLLVIGQAPYLAIGEGYIHCSDFSKLSAAVQEALNLKPAREDKIVAYISAIMAIGIRFPASLLWQFKPADCHTLKKTTQSVARQILDAAKTNKNEKEFASP